jgi:hypothetical protein
MKLASGNTHYEKLPFADESVYVSSSCSFTVVTDIFEPLKLELCLVLGPGCTIFQAFIHMLCSFCLLAY